MIFLVLFNRRHHMTLARLRWTLLSLIVLVFFFALASQSGGMISYKATRMPRENKTGIPSDGEVNRVEVWLKAKAKRLSRRSHINLHREDEEITLLYQKALPTREKNGDPRAQAKLAAIYFGLEHNKRVPIDREESFYWHILCAAQGYSPCLNNLGWFFGKTEGKIIANRRLEYSLYHMAAAQHYSGALCNLGFCHEYRIGGATKDPALAYYYYNLSALKGHRLGQYHTGLCHYHGIGVPINYLEAARYFKLSAAQNYRPAHEKIATMITEGQLAIDSHEPPIPPADAAPAAFDQIEKS